MKSALIFVVVAVALASASPIVEDEVRFVVESLSQLQKSGAFGSDLGRVTRSANPCSRTDGWKNCQTSAGRFTRSANPLFDSILGGGTSDDGAKGGLLGLNVRGTVDSILGTSGDAQRASKTSVFFKELHELIYNVLNSPNTPEYRSRNKYLARALVDKVRGGGFCDIQSGKGVSVEYAGLTRTIEY